jgi:hypothetical protein
MGTLLQFMSCRCCDEEEEEEQQEEEYGDHLQPAAQVRMTRAGSVGHADSAGNYQVAPQGSADEGDGDGADGTCCLPGSVTEENTHSAGVREFFQRLRARWRLHDSIAVIRDGEMNDDSNMDPRNPFGLLKNSGGSFSSPLRTASSFDSSKEIPTISAEEVVLPGSQLQKEMAKAMSLNLESQDDECVICMEGFDPTNPRMPTNCGCGRNKTYFHLPCLYQWIEQSRECPSCRQKLRWKEL